MGITRTPMIDDDGSGRTGTIINNAWKTELYGQIDQLVGNGVPWTPVDGSGAGLVFPANSAYYARHGGLVIAHCNLTFPVTSNGAIMQLYGLPNPIWYSGFYTTYPVNRIYHFNVGGGIFAFDPTTGAQITNAQMSGQYLSFAGVYCAAP